ncbi:MAG TPA: V-type ATP synthase subunit D [Rhodocyclaceae bacterium]|nr:V-type ATP synthase subunit D [Rhodocyclaceae bacterium]
MSDVTPTRAAVLELCEERRAMRDGYAFLDEKRLLLAAEMLHELKRYEQSWAEFCERLAHANEALQAACARHGLHGVQVYPAARLADLEVTIRRRQLLGVRLQEAAFEAECGAAHAALNPSPEAERCRLMFFELLRQGASLAALSGNLKRLQHEYRRTERRARALEDVLIPELERTIAEVESRLEEAEQGEAMRVRHANRGA